MPGLLALLATTGAALSVAVLPAAALAASSPAIEWTNAWNLAPTDATVGAGINPEGLSDGAFYQFQLVKSTSEYLPEMFCSEGGVVQPVGQGCGGNWGTPPEVIPLGGKVEGSKGQQVSLDLAGAGVTLTPGTTYHYRVLSAKALAEEEGGIFWEHPSVIAPDQTFTTPLASAPSIESESTSSVTPTAATLDATVNSEDLPQGAFYQFQIVKSTSEYLPELACPEPSLQLNSDDGCNSPDVGLQPTPGALPIGFIAKGAEGQSVSQSLTAAGITLRPGMTYHYRVLAVKRVQSEDGINWEGPTVAGPDHTFTTTTPPVIDSVSLSHLTPTDATLEATIDTEGQSTIYQFKLRINLCPYSECIGYKDIPLPSGLLLGSFAGQTVNVDLNAVGVSLARGVYEYALSATSAAGHVQTEWQTLVPPVLDPLSPAVSTPSGDGQPNASNSGDQPTGSGGASSSSTPSVHSPGTGPGKTTKLEPFENAQKLSKALKLCNKKPKKQRPICKRQAEKKYSATNKHRA
jgi:hypothetical protein